jgi:threonine dehydratase
MTLDVTLDTIRDAARLLEGEIIRTPALPVRRLSRATGAEVYLKLENLQVTGSFKVRGAGVKLASLSDAERAKGVVAASAGNHAQGVAFHAGRLDISATIFMPEGTPFTKVGRTEDLGAKVVLEGIDFNAAREAALAHAEETGKIFIAPFDDPHVIAGQGTVALELLEDVPDLDTLIVPIGGGGLMAGCAIAAHALNPKIDMIGCQTALYPSMALALKGEQPGGAGTTIAEGIAVKTPGDITRPIIEQHVKDISVLSEDEIEAAVLNLAEGQRIVAEGAGASGVAALMAHTDRFVGRKVGIVISGGNIDSRLLSNVLLRGLVRGGRMVSLRIGMSDKPGMLSEVSGLIGGLGGNILEVYHQRLFTDGPIRDTELDVVIETVDAEHVRQIVAALCNAGFETRVLSNRMD